MITLVKSKVKISQNFVAFSEYMNFDMCRSPRFSYLIPPLKTGACCQAQSDFGS